ncbi:glutamine synthetase family protein [Streptomyces sp. NPDC088725]|uniref:glutamine synthetase family protein n=1 Tax=Streptomyces sp. NPDC088725 TaxID=3365873 RepID=UPI0037F91904
MSAPHQEWHARGGRLTLDQLREEAGHGRVTTVELALTDIQGRQQGKRHHVRHFLDHVVPDGSDMCAYVLATDADMLPPTDFELVSWDSGIGDFQVRPDLTTIRTVPWDHGTVLVHADAFLDGRPVEVSPRRVLSRALDRLAARGLHVRTGIETEFTLYRGSHLHLEETNHQRLRPVSARNRDFALDLDPATSRYLRLLQDALEQAGLPIEAAKSEAAPGQVEITFPYGDPMAACDGHTLFKRVARHTGHRTRLAPTFMATPQNGSASGLHLHLSLWRDGAPAFTDTAGGLSPLGEHAVAGLLTALPDLTPLWAPNANSYRRYAPETGAPTSFTWGHDNRTCAVRVVGRENPHLEIRLPGADANPYLALTAALAAIEYGIENALKPPPPCAGNAYADHTAPPVHQTLGAALGAFRDSPLTGALLTPGVATHYAKVAQLELDALPGGSAPDTEVTAAEHERWFSRA